MGLIKGSNAFARGFALTAPLMAVLAVGCAADDDEQRVSELGVPRGEGPAIELQRFGLTTTGGLAADSYVRSGTYANTNYGSATTVQNDGDDAGIVFHGYLRFAVGNVGAISNVKLRFYVTNASAGPYYVRRVANNTWTESGITWNNKPAPDATNIATITSASANTWKEVDITSLVTAPNATYSLAIIPGTTDGMDFSSRNATSNQPQIVITSAGTGTTTPVPAQANTKIAFVGDTADGANWTGVLNLVLAEGAQAVVVAGDMTYDADPNGWWSATEGKVGQTYPVFLARGNHDDSSWSGFLPEASNHLGGATRIAGAHDANYLTVFKGVSLVAIKKGDTAARVNDRFSGRAEISKICYWHQNQNKLQVGGKGDEMGYDVYEACKNQGAIIINGHEHTYHRTKTLSSFTNQTISSSCATGSSLCVGPGRSWLAVVGTGGTGLRDQVRCAPTASSAPYASLNTTDASCPIWASIYTSNQGAQFGALFLTFHVDGNPKKGTGYFKNVSGQVIDSFTFYVD
ncbi:MAG: DNRLRE domain-containing protein [Deltaproteobacteria bacterium]|nr:DNRLRE domain-containing protein [Deltaproteobacteria bacterium]